MKEKKISIQLTEDQIDTLLLGLRYLELHHPITPKSDGNDYNYRADFKNVLNAIYREIKQTSMFPK